MPGLVHKPGPQLPDMRRQRACNPHGKQSQPCPQRCHLVVEGKRFAIFCCLQSHCSWCISALRSFTDFSIWWLSFQPVELDLGAGDKVVIRDGDSASAAVITEFTAASTTAAAFVVTTGRCAWVEYTVSGTDGKGIHLAYREGNLRSILVEN